MRKSATLPLVLVFLTASCVMAVNPVFSSAAVTEDSWATKAPMHQARAGLGVIAVNGKIYAIGGTTVSTSNAYTGGFVGTNEEYDPATDTWTYRKPMPTPRAYFAIAAYGNKIYCIGGAVGMNVNEIGFYSYNTSGVNEVYDTVTNTWETKTPLPDDTMKFQAHVVKGKIYVIAWSHMYVYDPTDDSWTTKTSMPRPYPHSSLVSAAVDNKIIVTGEFQTGYSLRSEQKVLIYETETDKWNEGTSGLTAVVEGAAGATSGVKAPQGVYVLGLDILGAASINQVYDPKADAWALATSMPAKRIYFGIAVINDALYVIGGHLSSGEVTGANEQYYPIGYEVPPEIKIISPENITYNNRNITLTFFTSESTSEISYSLDGQDNVTITGNTTLTEVPDSCHNLTVYATNQFGNTGASETVHFNVNAQEPFPTIPVATVSVAIIALVVAVLLVYFRKHKVPMLISACFGKASFSLAILFSVL